MTIAKFKLVDNNLEEKWNELSKKIQTGMTQADGFISRDTGKDEQGNFYCIVKFETIEQKEKNMREAEKQYPEMFKVFSELVDMSTMTKVNLTLN